MTETQDIQDRRIQIDQLLLHCETADESSLDESSLLSGWKPNEQEKFRLLKTLEDRPNTFKCVARWGEGENTDSRAFNLLKYLISNEKIQSEFNLTNTQVLDGVEGGSNHVQNDYCQVAHNLLRYVPELMQASDEGENNILHLVCKSGTRSMAHAIMKVINHHDDLDVEDLLEQPNLSGQRPTTLAVSGSDIDLLKLVAGYDDSKRQDHVLEAIKKQSLPFLKVLLSRNPDVADDQLLQPDPLRPELLRPDVDELLNESLYSEAAKVANKLVWEFLAETYPARARLHQNLREAVTHRKVDIVRHMLTNYPEVLECQEELLETTTKAVELSRRTEAGSVRTGTSKARAKGDVRAKDKAVLVSKEIEELLLDKMVRSLDPAVVQACWPRKKGRGPKEVTMELDLRSPLGWAWFCQIVKTAEQEVRAWQERENEAQRQLKKAEMEARRQLEANSRWEQELDQRSSEFLSEMDQLIGSGQQTPELKRVLEAAKTSFTAILKKAEPSVTGQTNDNSLVNTNGHPSNGHVRSTPPVNVTAGHGGNVSVSHATNRDVASRYNIAFQPILKSVTIPNLDRFRDHECAAEISHLFGSEVKHVLQWLRLVKGVRKILKLRVLDSRHQPHSEETIEDAIKALSVEELDWKRLDLSTRAVKDAATTVHTLHLYASGSWSPIYHWVGQSGLDLLEGTSLRNLNITIIKDSQSGLSPSRIQEQENMISESLQTRGWKPEGQDVGPQEKQFCTRTSPWIIAGPPAPGNRDVAVVRDPRTVIRLSKFVPWYEKTHRKEGARRSLVAVLDSGIDQGQFEPNHDLDGQSFSGSHWWLSSEQHGTQMAKIITSIDPCCQLWVAKVADHRASITIDAVVKALRTAIDIKADIISMSFALNSDSRGLEHAINDAHAKGIVLVCSTADEGENRTHAWPASYPNTLAIAACNDAGEKLVSSTTEAQYYFRGENVLYEPAGARGSSSGGGGGGGNAEKISGSSVATAIAAGVAALCLACCEIDGDGAGVDPRDRFKTVVDLFNRAKDKDGKYVRPWNLFGETGRGDAGRMFLADQGVARRS